MSKHKYYILSAVLSVDEQNVFAHEHSLSAYEQTPTKQLKAKVLKTNVNKTGISNSKAARIRQLVLR